MYPMNKAGLAFIVLMIVSGFSDNNLSAQQASTQNAALNKGNRAPAANWLDRLTPEEFKNAKNNVMPTQDNKQIIYKFLKSIFENYKGDKSEFIQLLSKDFVLWDSGKTKNYNEFLEHFAEIHRKIKQHKVDFINIVEDSNIVFTHHIVTVIRDESDITKVEVFAEWTVADGLVQKVSEVKYIHEK